MACACLLFASWSLVLSWCGAAHPGSTPSGACCVGNARRMSKILRQKGLCVAIAGHPGRTPSGACDVGNARFTTCIHTLVHPCCTPSGACIVGNAASSWALERSHKSIRECTVAHPLPVSQWDVRHSLLLKRSRLMMRPAVFDSLCSLLRPFSLQHL